MSDDDGASKGMALCVPEGQGPPACPCGGAAAVPSWRCTALHGPWRSERRDGSGRDAGPCMAARTLRCGACEVTARISVSELSGRADTRDVDDPCVRLMWSPVLPVPAVVSVVLVEEEDVAKTGRALERAGRMERGGEECGCAITGSACGVVDAQALVTGRPVTRSAVFASEPPPDDDGCSA